MEVALKKFSQIISKCTKEGINPSSFDSIQSFIKQHQQQANGRTKTRKIVKISAALVVLWLAIVLKKGHHSKRCLLELPQQIRAAFRPPENCDFCRNIYEVDRVSGIQPAEFALKYAYSATPVIVEDATQNWTAIEVFDYWFFRDVYANAKRKQKILNCQFLPYKTGFRDLFEAFEMPRERVNSEGPNAEPWYFGWSNCNPETAEILRKHYGRLYFLPETSENSAVDWIFMGTPGLGAHMHIDNVRLPSWQAQLSGRKRWILAPPPECYFECRSFETIVETGDVIVLDTNKWYHQTMVLEGNLSITIGAEYD